MGGGGNARINPLVEGPWGKKNSSGERKKFFRRDNFGNVAFRGVGTQSHSFGRGTDKAASLSRGNGKHKEAPSEGGPGNGSLEEFVEEDYAWTSGGFGKKKYLSGRRGFNHAPEQSKITTV